jgi:hypothetical protein
MALAPAAPIEPRPHTIHAAKHRHPACFPRLQWDESTARRIAVTAL